MALSVGHPRGTHSRYVIGCCLIPLGNYGLIIIIIIIIIKTKNVNDKIMITSRAKS